MLLEENIQTFGSVSLSLNKLDRISEEFSSSHWVSAVV